MKKCNVCGKIKPFDELCRDSSRSDGVKPLCKECKHKKDADYWKDNAWRLTKRNKGYKHRSPERYQDVLKQQREYKAKNRERSLYLQARKRSEKFSLPFSIAMEDIEIPDVCPLLGIPINKKPSKLNNRDNSPSLDRIIPSMGYVSWSEFNRQLEYKCKWSFKYYIKIGRFEPTSKTCSKCGCVQEMPLSKRVFDCPDCGISIDRDLNASLNIRNIGINTVGHTL